MNVNLHIDSIVLDGLALGPGESQLLQQTVASELTTILTERTLRHSLNTTNDLADQQANSPIHLGATVDAASLGPQLVNAIYANIPQSSFGLHAGQGGQS